MVFWINIAIAFVLTYLFAPKIVPDELGALGIIGFFIVIYFLLWFLSGIYNKKHFKKVPRIASLFVYFIKELVVASLKVAYDIVTPSFLLNPGVIAFPLEAKSDLEITILANMISLTPGTLSLAVSDDRKMLYIHTLYMDKEDNEAVKNNIKTGFERRLLEITR